MASRNDITMQPSDASNSQSELWTSRAETSAKRSGAAASTSASFTDDARKTISNSQRMNGGLSSLPTAAPRDAISTESGSAEQTRHTCAPSEETKGNACVDDAGTDEPLAVSKATKSLSKEELASVGSVRETPRVANKQEINTAIPAISNAEGSHGICDAPRYAYPIKILPMRPKNAILWPSASAALETIALNTQRQRSPKALSEARILYEGSQTPRQDTARLLVSPFRGLYQVTNSSTPRYVPSDNDSVWLRLNADEVLAVESPARLLEERRAGAPWRAPSAFKLTPVRNANGLTAGAALDALAAAALGFCGGGADTLEDVATGTEYMLVRVGGSKRLAIKRWGDGCRLFYVQSVDSSGGNGKEGVSKKENDNPELNAEEKFCWPLYNKTDSRSVIDRTMESEAAYFATLQDSITSTQTGALDRLLSTPRQLESHSRSVSFPFSYSQNDLPFQASFAKTPRSELLTRSDIAESSCYAPSIASVSTVARQTSSIEGSRRGHDGLVAADRKSFWNQVKQRLIMASSAAVAPFTAC